MTNDLGIRPFNFSARFCRLLVIAALAGSAFATRAQVQMFLRLGEGMGGISPVIGDSQDQIYKGADGFFEITGFTLKVVNSQAIGTTGGLGGGRAQFFELALGKTVDARTPALFKALASGGHWKYAQLIIRKPGETTGFGYATYDFNTVFLTSQEWMGAAQESVLPENLKFVYGALKISIRPNPTTSTIPSQYRSSWNQIKNSEEFEEIPN